MSAEIMGAYTIIQDCRLCFVTQGTKIWEMDGGPCDDVAHPHKFRFAGH